MSAYKNGAGPYLEKIVRYNNTSGTYSDGEEYLSDSHGGATLTSEDALIYYVKGWNTSTSTGYCSIYDDNGTQHLNVGDGSTKAMRYVFAPNIELQGSPFYFGHWDGNTNSNTVHNLLAGQWVKYNNGGGTNIGGLTSGTEYYVVYRTATTYRLAASHAAAVAGNYITITSEPSETGHYFTFSNADYRIFQAACGPDYEDATPDVSQQIASFQWVFPHPIAARNGFVIQSSAGIITEIGYRAIGKRTPYGTVIGEAPTTDQKASYNISKEICLKNVRISGSSEFNVTEGPAEVWGMHIMNNNTTLDKETRIEDGNATGTIATFRISKSIETADGDVVLNASRYGPINFPLPLICKTQLRYAPATNCQSSILYREINKDASSFPDVYSD